MIENIKNYDKNFDESMFLSKADHIFIMILDAIMERDMSSVKHYLSDEVYTKFNDMTQSYLNSNKIRLFDEMNVKSTHLNNVFINEGTIDIEVIITSRYMDYFINEDGDYLSGINDHRIEKNHRINFTKRIDAQELKEARRCPSCGNTLDINNTGICPYCNQTIDMSKYDYIITEMDLV